MGTDREEYHRGPCKCGKGMFEIDHCSPDHVYGNAATSWWWAKRIKCPDCEARYELYIGTGKDRRILLKDKTTGNVLEELPRIAL